MTIRVVLADDQPIVRAGFQTILDAQPDIEVVGEAADGVEAVNVVERLRPDVVVMDIRMPNLDGISATDGSSSDDSSGATKVLVLTTFDLDDYVYEALRAGASGYLLKDTTRDELVAAVKTVAKGDALLAPSVTRHLIAEFVRRPEPAAATLPTWTASLPESARCSSSSPAAGRTPRSRRISSSARPP